MTNQTITGDGPFLVVYTDKTMEVVAENIVREKGGQSIFLDSEPTTNSSLYAAPDPTVNMLLVGGNKEVVQIVSAEEMSILLWGDNCTCSKWRDRIRDVSSRSMVKMEHRLVCDKRAYRDPIKRDLN